MVNDKHNEDGVVLPVAKVVAVAGTALPPLTIAAVGLPIAAAAFFLHWKRSKDLKGQYKAAKATLHKLLAERDSALAERDAALRNVMVHLPSP